MRLSRRFAQLESPVTARIRDLAMCKTAQTPREYWGFAANEAWLHSFCGIRLCTACTRLKNDELEAREFH